MTLDVSVCRLSFSDIDPNFYSITQIVKFICGRYFFLYVRSCGAFACAILPFSLLACESCYMSEQRDPEKSAAPPNTNRKDN